MKALRIHPDKGGDQEQFLKLKEAYDSLMTAGSVEESFREAHGEAGAENDLPDFLKRFWERFAARYASGTMEEEEEEEEEDEVDLDEDEEGGEGEEGLTKENCPQHRSESQHKSEAKVKEFPLADHFSETEKGGSYETGFNINNGFRYQKINVDKVKAEKAAMYEKLLNSKPRGSAPPPHPTFPGREKGTTVTPPFSSSTPFPPPTRPYIPEKEPPRGTKAHRRWVLESRAKRNPIA